MNYIKITYLLVLLSILHTFNVYAQNDLKEQISVPLSDPGKPGFLKVGLTNGSIQVNGYEGKEVIIEATAFGGREDSGKEITSNGMRRISIGGSFELTAKESDNKITIHTDSWRRKINLAIKVPRNFALKLSAVNDGNITVDNVSGELEISNVNGTITLNQISGSAVANTVNGDLKVVFKEVTPDTPMAFTTLNGDVDVTFTGNVKANTKIKSDRGEIFTDFDMEMDKNNPKVEQKTGDGVYKVSIDNWVYGKINGGGPEMLFKNMNGNIYIRKNK